MQLVIRFVLWSIWILMGFTLTTGKLRWIGSTPEEFHMPLGLLTLILTLFGFAFVLSFLLTSAWNIQLETKARGRKLALYQESVQIKTEASPWIGIPALLAVVTGAMGMAVRALVLDPQVHFGAASTLFALTGIAAYRLGPRLKRLEEIMDELGIDEASRERLEGRPQD